MADQTPSGPEYHPDQTRTVFERFFSTRQLPVTLAVIAVVLAGTYCAWWFWLAGEVRTAIDGWAEAMRLDGRQVVIDRVDVSGFPGPIGIAMDGIEIAEPIGGWAMAVTGVRGSLAPWRTNRLSGVVMGPVDLEVRRGPAAGRYRFEAERSPFLVSADDTTLPGLPSLRLDLQALEATHVQSGATIRAETVRATLTRGSTPVYGALDLDARNISLPQNHGSPFGDTVARLVTRIEAIGAELPPGPTRAAMQRWVDDGGAIDVRRLDAEHGALGMAGDGTVALDLALQPQGAFSVRIGGFNAAIDRLVADGVIAKGDGSLAKTVLGVMAKVPPGGGRKEVEVPLTVQDQILSVGPLKLLRLPTIGWPE